MKRLGPGLRRDDGAELRAVTCAGMMALEPRRYLTLDGEVLDPGMRRDGDGLDRREAAI